MSFLDYLKDNRGHYIDHRFKSPETAMPSALQVELELEAEEGAPGASASTRSARYRRRLSPATRIRSIRYRQVRPAFSPSPYTDPLPYEEPWERAFR